MCSSDKQKICIYYTFNETESKLGWVPCPSQTICNYGEGCVTLTPSPTPTTPFSQKVKVCRGRQKGECLDKNGRCIPFFGIGQSEGYLAYQPCPSNTICLDSSCVTPAPAIRLSPSPALEIKPLPTLTPTPTPAPLRFGLTFKYCSPSNKNYIYTLAIPPKREPCGHLRVCSGLPLFAKCVDLPRVSIDDLPLVTYTPAP